MTNDGRLLCQSCIAYFLRHVLRYRTSSRTAYSSSTSLFLRVCTWRDMCVRMRDSWRDGSVFFFAVLRDVAMTGTHDFRARAHHDLRLLEWLFYLLHPLLEFSLGLKWTGKQKRKYSVLDMWWTVPLNSRLTKLGKTLAKIKGFRRIQLVYESKRCNLIGWATRILSAITVYH